MEKITLNNKEGYSILGINNHGLFIYIDKGIFQGHPFQKIKMVEIFKAKDGKLRWQRKPASEYDKEVKSYWLRLGFEPELISEVLKILSMFYLEIFKEKIDVAKPMEAKEKKEVDDEIEELLREGNL